MNQHRQSASAGKKVLVLLAEGFEELELVSPLDIFRRGELEVTLAAIGDDLRCRSTRGLEISADTLLANLGHPEESGAGFDLLYLPGGRPGADNLLQSELVLSWVRYFDASKKLLAAICAAPLVLATAGVIKHKTVTSFPAVQEEIQPLVGSYSTERVVQDSHILTSRGAGTAAEFSFYLLALLQGKEVSETVRKSMLFLGVGVEGV